MRSAEAEIVAWHVKVGDRVEEDQQLADMMTDKATVEMESPVSGTVVELAGEVGDQVAIGAMLVVIETDGDAAAEPAQAADGAAEVEQKLGGADEAEAFDAAQARLADILDRLPVALLVAGAVGLLGTSHRKRRRHRSHHRHQSRLQTHYAPYGHTCCVFRCPIKSHKLQKLL